ncbi:hypothetical protein [Aeromonas media]|uniref:hypothetical protein n=1 Tax=Aeromonas media TaxID=651 RepID=UPI003D19701E
MVNSAQEAAPIGAASFYCRADTPSIESDFITGESALIFTYFQPLAIIENLFMNPTFWISFNGLIFKVIFILFREDIGKGFHGETVIFIR